jgi:hypothetical protein
MALRQRRSKPTSACGTINRVTILLDKFTGHPKGCAPFSFRIFVNILWSAMALVEFVANRYAYVEFASPAFVDAAMVLNESLFRGRLIKVCSPPSMITLSIDRPFRIACTLGRTQADKCPRFQRPWSWARARAG